MTARKHFKQLVRERMRRTGEHYSVARRHVATKSAPDAWELRGGIDGDTAAFANVLANLGVALSGEALSEAMILGVGGGLGAGYILWEFESESRSRVLTLGFRRLWQYPARWAEETAQRLGLHAVLHETGSARRAAELLDAQLDRGLPAIIWIDSFQLGLRGEPESLDGRGGPPVIVYGRSGDMYEIDDRSLARETVTGERLAAARARVVSYRHRMITIDPELVDLDGDRLRTAVEDGLRLQVEHLSAKSSSFSLPAWRKWARMTIDTRNAKGWPRVFADGRGIASVRATIYTDAAGAANLRGLYADFLDEAADLLARPELRQPAHAWRQAAAAWDVIVDTALPPGDQLRQLIDRGDQEARWALQAERDLADVLPPLTDAVTAVYEAETAALAVLEGVVSP